MLQNIKYDFRFSLKVFIVPALYNNIYVVLKWVLFPTCLLLHEAIVWHFGKIVELLSCQEDENI